MPRTLAARDDILQSSFTLNEPLISMTAESTQYEKFRQAYDSTPSDPWQITVMEKLTALYLLPDNWDGNGTPVIDMAAGMFGLLVLRAAMLDRSPAPDVVPSASGGVQFEWHQHGIDLELHIAAAYDCELWFEDHRGEVAPISRDLSSDFSDLRNSIKILTKRH